MTAASEKISEATNCSLQSLIDAKASDLCTLDLQAILRDQRPRPLTFGERNSLAIILAERLGPRAEHEEMRKQLDEANRLIRFAANPPHHDPIGGIGWLKRDLQNYIIELDRIAAQGAARGKG